MVSGTWRHFWCGTAVTPIPYSLHPTPHTLHPTPYTVHRTLNNLNPTLNTIHRTPYTLHPSHGVSHGGTSGAERRSRRTCLPSALFVSRVQNFMFRAAGMVLGIQRRQSGVGCTPPASTSSAARLSRPPPQVSSFVSKELWMTGPSVGFRVRDLKALLVRDGGHVARVRRRRVLQPLRFQLSCIVSTGITISIFLGSSCSARG